MPAFSCKSPAPFEAFVLFSSKGRRGIYLPTRGVPLCRSRGFIQVSDFLSSQVLRVPFLIRIDLCFILVSLLPLSCPHIILSKIESINTIGKYTANTNFSKSASLGSFRHFRHSLYLQNLCICQHVNYFKSPPPSSSFSCSFLSFSLSVALSLSLRLSLLSLHSHFVKF